MNTLKRLVYLVNTKVPTKTALVRVTNDLLLNLDKTKSTFYIGLDLSAAFDTLDHALILSILETSLGFKDNVLSFLTNSLSSRSQKVLIDGQYSMPRTLKMGVPQGSVPAPVFFLAILFVWNFCLNVLISIIIFMPMTLIYFVYHASINQGAFDLILTTLQKLFS